MAASSATIDVVLPVHNEGASIADTLREFHRVVMLEGGQPIRFVVCEEGSSDDTVRVLQKMPPDCRSSSFPTRCARATRER